jgi:hypothetical protein
MSCPPNVVSDAFAVSREAVSGDSTCWPSSPGAAVVQDSPEIHVQMRTERQTTSHTEQDSHSPRKPIPSQWLSKASGPRLATAQRARVRETKKDSPNGSPIDSKPLRGARSFHDTSRLHATEGATFLTKEALAAVENDITSPTLRHSPSKLQQPKAKPSWNSPAQSPKYETLRKAAKSSLKLSPTKVALLSPTTGEHKRASSSITTVGAVSYRTAHGSPVRSLADSPMSCMSTEDFLEEKNLSETDLAANKMNIQATKDSPGSKVQTSKATVSPKARSSRPQLFVNISETPSDSDTGPQSASTVVSAMSSSVASEGLRSPESPSQASRIPRPLIWGNTGDARGPTLSSSLKRAKSVASLASPKATSSQERSPTDGESSPPRTDGPAPRQVRTVDSSGATPVTTYHLAPGKYPSNTPSEVNLADTSSTEEPLQSLDTALDNQEGNANTSSEPTPANNEDMCGQSSRTTSTSTVKATPFWDPAAVDSAVIYSRKSIALGMVPVKRQLLSPNIHG